MFYTKSNNFKPGIYADYTDFGYFILESYSPRTMCGSGYWVEDFENDTGDDGRQYCCISRFDLEKLDYIGV